MLRFATIVTIQRGGELDATSLTDRTSPVTGEPATINVVFSPRYCAKRQRRANFKSVVSKVCMLLPMVAVRETVPRSIIWISGKY
jgi:hypothetical protein